MDIAIFAHDSIVHLVDDVRWLECVESGLPEIRNQWSIRTSEW